MKNVLAFFGGLFLFGALTRAVAGQPLARVLAGVFGLILTSAALMIAAFLTGFAGAHPAITGGTMLVLNALGVANLLRQGNPDSSLLARGIVGGIATFAITPLASYAAGIGLGLLIVALHAIR